jgi:DNA-binding NarL/FixJ family response regulator
VQFILTPLWGLAEAELASGDANAAVERCEDGWRIASAAQERALFIPFVVTGARSLIAARRPDDAERWVGRASDYLAAWEPIATPPLTHADGLVRMAAGSMSAAREALERAVSGWEERSRTWEITAARLDLAQCLMRMNRHADAAALLDTVRAKAEEIGSPPISARVAELEKLSHGRGADAEAWRPLTVREFEVARLIANGLTNAQIAAELVVSPKTVSAHVEHILAKLGVGRRTEIATWATTVRGTDASAARAGLSAAGTG